MEAMAMEVKLPAIVDNINKRKLWWEGLEDEWKRAFHQAVLRTGDILDMPTDEQLIDIWTCPNMRFVSPQGPYHNMNFQLTNLSGIKDMTHVRILVASFHRIESIEEVSTIPELESLFMHCNEIQDLSPVSELVHLENLFVQNNQISSITAIKNLTQLHTVYVLGNPLSSLEGITEEHSKNLKKFYVLPNDDLPQKEIIQCENMKGVRCLSVG